jgi:hypothetical protein
MQSFRLSTATNKCLALAKSVRLQEALQADVAKDIAEEIQFELKRSFRSGRRTRKFRRQAALFSECGRTIPALIEQLEQANAGLNVRKLATVLARISRVHETNRGAQRSATSVLRSAKGEAGAIGKSSSRGDRLDGWDHVDGHAGIGFSDVISGTSTEKIRINLRAAFCSRVARVGFIRMRFRYLTAAGLPRNWRQGSAPPRQREMIWSWTLAGFLTRFFSGP